MERVAIMRLSRELSPRPHLLDSEFHEIGRNKIQRGTPVGNRSKLLRIIKLIKWTFSNPLLSPDV